MLRNLSSERTTYVRTTRLRVYTHAQRRHQLMTKHLPGGGGSSPARRASAHSTAAEAGRAWAVGACRACTAAQIDRPAARARARASDRPCCSEPLTTIPSSCRTLPSAPVPVSGPPRARHTSGRPCSLLASYRGLRSCFRAPERVRDADACMEWTKGTTVGALAWGSGVGKYARTCVAMHGGSALPLQRSVARARPRKSGHSIACCAADHGSTGARTAHY